MDRLQHQERQPLGAQERRVLRDLEAGDVALLNAAFEASEPLRLLAAGELYEVLVVDRRELFGTSGKTTAFTVEANSGPIDALTAPGAPG